MLDVVAPEMAVVANATELIADADIPVFVMLMLQKIRSWLTSFADLTSPSRLTRPAATINAAVVKARTSQALRKADEIQHVGGPFTIDEYMIDCLGVYVSRYLVEHTCNAKNAKHRADFQQRHLSPSSLISILETKIIDYI